MDQLSRSDFLTRSALALAGGSGLLATACGGGGGSAYAPLTLTDYIAQLRAIPGGTFRMGANQGFDDQKPEHEVTLSPFRMGATPVTVGMWREYCAATSAQMPAAPLWGWEPTHPVVGVSWEEIAGPEGVGGYCDWASRRMGFQLSVPTEAQFEYCARDGGKDIAYPWGNSFDRSKLWCSSEELRDVGRTAPVARFSNVYRNSYGLTDMAGNVWHWCSDWHGDYPSGPVTDPGGPPSGEWRCLRGGSWDEINPDYLRCAMRGAAKSWSTNDDFGFRLCARAA